MRSAFARVVEEFEVHAQEQDTGVFQSLLQLMQDGGATDTPTPTMSRYRSSDPTRALRDNLSQPPAPQRSRKSHWSTWFKKAFSIQGPAVRY